MRPHKKLEVWKEGMTLVKKIYEMVAQFPDDEKFGLVSQLKRASVSVPTNIAEGAARNTEKEFLRFLYIARGSLSEVDTLLQLSEELDFMRKDQFDLLIQQVNRINAMLNGLIKKLSS